MRVIVLDADDAASGASGNSFAWLNAVSKEPDAYHRLNAMGMAEYDALVAEVGGEQLIHRGGALRWAESPAQQTQLDQLVERLQGRGYAARWISPEETSELEPGLRLPPDVLRVALFDHDAWVDGPEIVHALLDRVREKGDVVEQCAVTGIIADDGRVSAIETERGTVSVGALLLCAGIATPELARMLGVRIPVERVPGLLAVTAPVPASTLNRIVLHHTVHLRPDLDGRIRMGAPDLDGEISEETPTVPLPSGAAQLLERAARLLPALEGVAIERAHVGVRPIPADGYTVAGRFPGWENAYVLVTHSGITLGPLLGRLLAEDMTGADPDPLLAEFRPGRFARGS